MTKAQVQDEFTVEGCRVCINVKDWVDRVQRATLSKQMFASAVGSAGITSAAVSSDVSSLASSICPPDASELGRATWTFLHTMSVYYPQNPSPQQQSDMHSLLQSISRFYPCEPCASHMQAQLLIDPPQVSSRLSLANWLCRLHNKVNVRLGKPAFNCGNIFERWRDGPSDGSCGVPDL